MNLLIPVELNLNLVTNYLNILNPVELNLNLVINYPKSFKFLVELSLNLVSGGGMTANGLKVATLGNRMGELFLRIIK